MILRTPSVSEAECTNIFRNANLMTVSPLTWSNSIGSPSKTAPFSHTKTCYSALATSAVACKSSCWVLRSVYSTLYTSPLPRRQRTSMFAVCAYSSTFSAFFHGIKLRKTVRYVYNRRARAFFLPSLGVPLYRRTRQSVQRICCSDSGT